MNTIKKNTAYILTFTFVSAIAFIFLFIAVGMVPFWQQLSGIEIQAWWSDHFVKFGFLMIFIHLLSIITSIYAYRLNRKEDDKQIKRLWLIALVTLLICQALNFVLYGGFYNAALMSGTLEPQIALETFDNWCFYHKVRTAFVWFSFISFIIIGIKSKK